MPKRAINVFSRKDLTTNPLPNYWDIIAFTLVVGGLMLFAWHANAMISDYHIGEELPIDLSIYVLPNYAVRSFMRMFIALFFSLLATFIFGTWAAKNKLAEKIIIPMIDILQSVPILGFLTIATWVFISLFPGSIFGLECAAIFVVFTAQVWNMILSLYQSLSTVPTQLLEVARVFQLNRWQQFWRVEIPYAMPDLIWNTMLSLSSAWFYVVASEAITIASHQKVLLPGIGSYISKAAQVGNTTALWYAIITLFIIILIYDQLFFRPMNHWVGKFHGADEADEKIYRSWIVNIFSRARLAKWIWRAGTHFITRFVNLMPASQQVEGHGRKYRLPTKYKTFIVTLLLGVLGVMIVLAINSIYRVFYNQISVIEVVTALKLGAITGLRVFIMIFISLIIWCPIGVWIGLNSRWSKYLQPLIQFLAAFPPNALYPSLGMLIIAYKLNFEIWTAPIMMLGGQWYILFNVISGTKELPKELLYAAKSLQVHSLLWWRRVILPGIFPRLLIGIITASGGAWNATILTEYFAYGNTKIVATGLGSYIEMADRNGNMGQFILGITVMCLYVLLINRLIWNPLLRMAQKRFAIK